MQTFQHILCSFMTRRLLQLLQQCFFRRTRALNLQWRHTRDVLTSVYARMQHDSPSWQEWLQRHYRLVLVNWGTVQFRLETTCGNCCNRTNRYCLGGGGVGVGGNDILLISGLALSVLLITFLPWACAAKETRKKYICNSNNARVLLLDFSGCRRADS
jgi:hypothetical protein